jgi:alpha-tubulin suppressor-like RCC1 family protein
MTRITIIALCGWLLSAATPAVAQSASILDRPATQVEAGGIHTCASTPAGGVRCWGYNGFGQLGNESDESSSTPVEVEGFGSLGLGNAVAAIAAGTFHTCALTTVGGVKCWGYNSRGQLGDGGDETIPVPVDVVGLSGGIVAITAGGLHTCALAAAGEVLCWGDNEFGQLGDGSGTGSATPVPVSGLSSGVVAIAAGGDHTCALTTTGGVLCWGANHYGQLGDGSLMDSAMPVSVSGLSSGVAAIAAGGADTCALTTAGAALCWGTNDDGQLGDGSGIDSATPVAVSGLSDGVVALSIGVLHTCALTAVGGVKCWGENGQGQLGDGSVVSSLVPVDVLDGATLAPLTGMAAIAVAATHTCAMSPAGGLRCWGTNDFGQLGNGNSGTNAFSILPAHVSGFADGISKFDAGYRHTCAVTTALGAKCWGSNEYGQLGDGTSTDRHTPVEVAGLRFGVETVAPGFFHTCALIIDGAIRCWGLNDEGELGDGSQNSSGAPVPVADLGGVAGAVAVGGFHSCALINSGSVRCWGYNIHGQLGDGSMAPRRLTPVTVTGLSGEGVAIAAGYNHTCALTNGGAVQCWGRNDRDQLGNGSTEAFSNVPVAVSGLSSGVTAITADGWHTCALTTAGGVKCWGFNDYGQLGNGTSLPGGTNSGVPVDVVGLASGVVAIAAGYRHTCALMADGGVQCWGANLNGRLGNNTTEDSPVPVTVVEAGNVPIDGVVAIAVGGAHSCAQTADGRLRCWGHNGNGELGNDDTADQHTPVSILASQTIDFVPPTDVQTGASINLTASATGGGTVTFDSWTPSTCTVADGLLATTMPGLCGVRASQAGGNDGAGGTVAPAPHELRLIEVGAEVIFANGFE